MSDKPTPPEPGQTAQARSHPAQGQDQPDQDRYPGGPNPQHFQAQHPPPPNGPGYAGGVEENAELSRQMQRGFDRVMDRMEHLESKMDDLGRRQDRLEQTSADQGAVVAGLDGKITVFSERQERLERAQERLEHAQGRLEHAFTDQKTTLDFLYQQNNHQTGGQYRPIGVGAVRSGTSAVEPRSFWTRARKV